MDVLCLEMAKGRLAVRTAVRDDVEDIGGGPATGENI